MSETEETVTLDPSLCGNLTLEYFEVTYLHYLVTIKVWLRSGKVMNTGVKESYFVLLDCGVSSPTSWSLAPSCPPSP